MPETLSEQIPPDIHFVNVLNRLASYLQAPKTNTLELLGLCIFIREVQDIDDRSLGADPRGQILLDIINTVYDAAETRENEISQLDLLYVACQNVDPEKIQQISETLSGLMPEGVRATG